MAIFLSIDYLRPEVGVSVCVFLLGFIFGGGQLSRFAGDDQLVLQRTESSGRTFFFFTEFPSFSFLY